MDIIKTGISGLDAITGGGIPVGSIVLVRGPSGSLKSTLAYEFCYRGAIFFNESTLYISLEQDRRSMMNMLKKIGLKEHSKCIFIDIASRRKSKEHFECYQYITKAIETNFSDFGITRLVIDSLNAFSVLSWISQDVRNELFRFMNFLRDMNITTFLVEEYNLGETQNIEEYMSDGIIDLGFLELEGRRKRFIMINKMRGMEHDMDKFSIGVSKDGIKIGEKYIIGKV